MQTLSKTLSQKLSTNFQTQNSYYGGNRSSLRNGRVLHGGTLHSSSYSLGTFPSLQFHSVSTHATKVVIFPWTLLAILFLFPIAAQALPEEIQVGGLFDTIYSDNSAFDQVAFLHAVDRVNTHDILPQDTKLVGRLEQVPYGDSFHAERKLCSLLEEGVAAIFGPQSPPTANLVQSVCSNFFLPHIESTWDFRTIRGNYSINLYPHPEILSKAFANLISVWGWDKYIILYENHQSLIRLKEILHQSSVFHGRHVRVKQLPENSNDYKPLFKQLRNTVASSSAIIIDCGSDKLHKIFADAREMGMMKDRRYFLTNLDIRVLSPNQFDPQDGLNITAFSIVDMESPSVQQVIREWANFANGEFLEEVPILPNNALQTQTALMYDAVAILAKALQSLDDSTFETTVINCRLKEDKWPDGQILLESLRNTELDGLSGRITLDPETGFRTKFQLNVMELTRAGFSRIGIYDTTEQSPDLEKRFTWTRTAEETLKQQEEDLKDKTLVVTTILGAPYCLKTADDNFTGYVPDLMERLAGLLEFQYVIKEVSDGKYGSPDNQTGEWNGMVGEVMSGVADMAVADLSISFNRQSAVDFTMPFMNLGISILYKTPAKDPPALFSFLEPFNPEVWICVMTAYVCISLVLFILARLSPRDWQEPPPCSPDNGKILENPFSMANCLWFSTGTIMGQGCDILPA